MSNKPAYSIADQISLLKQRGMLFKDEGNAPHFLENISYYRLKGYWWDAQNDFTNHTFKAKTYQEIFIKDHRNRYPNQDADAWKILEVASLGTLSKLYKNLNHQLPEKAAIAKEMGLNLHSELSSWLEAIAYVRNIIAHHSRLWCRNMVKRPTEKLNNPSGKWFDNALTQVQTKKPFLIISCMIYLCNEVTPGHQIKNKILDLFNNSPNIPIYKLGFLNNWKNQPLWQ